MKLYVDYMTDLADTAASLNKAIDYTREQKMWTTNGLLSSALLSLRFVLENAVRTNDDAELAALEDRWVSVDDWRDDWGTVPF